MSRKLKPTVMGWIPPPPPESAVGQIMARTRIPMGSPTGPSTEFIEPVAPKTGRSPLCDLESFIPPHEDGDYRFRFERNGVLVYELGGKEEPLKPLTGFVMNQNNPQRLIPLWPACVHLKPQSAERTPCYSYKLIMNCALTQVETTVLQCQPCPRKQLFEGD